MTFTYSKIAGLCRPHHHLLGVPFAAALLASAALMGCGADSTSATGELGRIDYRLATRYLSPDDSLLNVSLITGYDQRINTDLTGTGHNDTGDARAITHRIEPNSGATITALADGNDVPDISVKVAVAGDYTLTSFDGDKLFDRLTLNFDAPSDLELITWLRDSSDTFSRQPQASSYSVQEGTQVTFLPIPTNSDKVRLLGDIEFDVVVEPATAAVAVHNVDAVYEQSVVYHKSPLSLVFVEPGSVTVTVTDQVHTDVSTTVAFEVSAVGGG